MLLEFINPDDVVDWLMEFPSELDIPERAFEVVAERRSVGGLCAASEHSKFKYPLSFGSLPIVLGRYLVRSRAVVDEIDGEGCLLVGVFKEEELAEEDR